MDIAPDHPDAAREKLQRRECALSALINAVLSFAFFLLLFGWDAGRSLTMAQPDGLALDFLPQSGAVALMAALVPAFVLRAGLIKRSLLSASLGPSSPRIIVRALIMLALGLLLGVVLALLALFGPVAQLAWGTALAIKIAYGALLGLLVTRHTLRHHFALRSTAHGEGCNL